MKKICCINCKKYTYWESDDIEVCTIPVDDYYSKEHMIDRNPSNLNAQNDCLYYEEKRRNK